MIRAKRTRQREVLVRCDTLLTPSQRHRDCFVRVNQGKIVGIEPASKLRGPANKAVVHLPGTIVAPGFIDLHVHGAGGHDLMEAKPESLRVISATLARHGTTAFLATTLSAPDYETQKAIRTLVSDVDVEGGARPMGIHLEGPYLNPLRRGTHDSRYLSAPDIAAFLRLVDLSQGSICRITIAPEIDGALELIRVAAKLGIRVSLGHSDATYEQARAAVDAGATQATHVFNAMRPFHQREPGLLGVLLTDERIFAEIICDGHHVHTGAIRLLLRAKGIERTFLATDAISAADMPDGNYLLGDKTVAVQDGVCIDADGKLAGSALTMDRAARNLSVWLGIPFQEALIAATTAPAHSMGWETKGIVAPGADADLVFLDSNLNVACTMIAGRVVYGP